MTCKEKLIADHPEWTEERIDRIIKHNCPSDCGYLEDPTDEDGEPICYKHCSECWDREIPETENKKENEEMKVCEFTCEEKAKLIEEIETLRGDVEMREEENQGLRNKLAEHAQQIGNQRNLIVRRDEVIYDYRSKLKNLNQTNEDLANKLAVERAMVERLEVMVTTRDEEIAKLVKEIEEFEEAVKAKNERISELCARIDKLDEARYIEQDITMTKELFDKFNSCGTECALHPTDIARGIARHMRNKYDALIYVGFSHDDAMSLIPMWTD